MGTVDIPTLRNKIENLDSIPSMPAILMPVLRQLEGPIESIDIQRIIDLVSHDKSLAAQVLHMANSPLFGQWARVESIRSAVVTLGIARLREIVTSCCMLHLVPKTKSKLDPTVFWEHSLAVALVSRRTAKKIGMPGPEKAYLAGLLHDIGLIANLLLIPDLFEKSLQTARSRSVPLDRAEIEVAGIDHTSTGGVLADHWKLGPDLCEVIRCHHNVGRAEFYQPLVAVINIADLLCRMGQLGYGYEEARQLDFSEEPGWQLLMSSFPQFKQFDFARFTFEFDGYVKEVRNLVSVLFRMQ
jgi:putative nucleotidyltransferase with HDIG domain